MSATEITIKEGHLNPKTSKEVTIENDNWEVSVWVTDGKVEIVVVNVEDRPLSLTDLDNDEPIPFHRTATEAHLRFTAKR